VNVWHIVTSEYPPDVGGVSDYTRHVAEGLAGSGDAVHVWCPITEARREASRVVVHPELGRFRPTDLRRLSSGLDTFPTPRRLLVQWVPHGFGYRSMNLWFCFWLATRARRGDRVELMMHEAFVEIKRGPMRHVFMALVHRVMTLVLMGAASRVWVSIPAWELLLRPYALGRQVPIGWLPIPGCIGSQASVTVPSIRRNYVADSEVLLGHFGSYGREVSVLLEGRLVEILNGDSRPSLLLIGAGSEAFRDDLIRRHAAWAERLHAAGFVPSAELGAYIDACDIFLQPYPDGVTSRRTSTMACLAQGRPVVTTSGHLTEPLWSSTGAVVLADVSDARAFALAVVGLLGDREERSRIGWRGQRLYQERFTVSHVVDTLRATERRADVEMASCA